MQYTQNGQLHRIVRVTGPTHNLLGLEFGGADASKCAMERLGPATSEPGELSNEQVKAWVLEAVQEANLELGTSLVVRRIQYVADDTPQADAYRVIAKEIVRRAR